MALNKRDVVVFTGEMSSTNAGVWNSLDISAYTSNKQALAYFDFVHTTFATDPTEWGTYYMRGLADNVTPKTCNTVIDGMKGRMEVLTDDDGIVEWKSDYAWPYEKRVTLQITLINTLD